MMTLNSWLLRFIARSSDSLVAFVVALDAKLDIFLAQNDDRVNELEEKIEDVLSDAEAQIASIRADADKAIDEVRTDIDKAVRTARGVFEDPRWRDMSQTRRGHLLRRLGDRARTIGDLSGELGMDRTTLSRDLKPLLGNAWVESVTSEDARQRPVRTTAAGRRALAKAASASAVRPH